MSKIHVMSVVNNLVAGGVQKSAILLMNRMDKDFFEVSLCVLAKERGAMPYTNTHKTYYADGDVLKFKAIIYEQKPDIINFYRSGEAYPEPSPLKAAVECKADMKRLVIVDTNTFGNADWSPEYEGVDHTIHICKTNMMNYLDRIEKGPSLDTVIGSSFRTIVKFAELMGRKRRNA